MVLIFGYFWRIDFKDDNTGNVKGNDYDEYSTDVLNYHDDNIILSSSTSDLIDMNLETIQFECMRSNWVGAQVWTYLILVGNNYGFSFSKKKP